MADVAVAAASTTSAGLFRRLIPCRLCRQTGSWPTLRPSGPDLNDLSYLCIPVVRPFVTTQLCTEKRYTKTGHRNAPHRAFSLRNNTLLSCEVVGREEVLSQSTKKVVSCRVVSSQDGARSSSSWSLPYIHTALHGRKCVSSIITLLTTLTPTCRSSRGMGSVV